MSGPPAAPTAPAPAAEKPAVLQDQQFTIEEGFAYRAFRTGAIWMNKLFFSSLVLLGLWVVLGYAQQVEVCHGAGDARTCSVFLTPTAKYLGGMAVVSFLLSIAFGLLGLVVGKNVIQVTRAEDEPGARRPE